MCVSMEGVKDVYFYLAEIRGGPSSPPTSQGLRKQLYKHVPQEINIKKVSFVTMKTLKGTLLV